MSNIVKSPVNPITLKKVKKGQDVVRTLGPAEYAPSVAPEDGILVREDVGQRLRGRPIYIRNSDLQKLKTLKIGEEIVVRPWEG